MPEFEFTKSTDTEHKIKLTSSLVAATWRSGTAYGGQSAEFEVRTAFVGNGAKIQIKGKSAKGKKLGKIKDTISNNLFVGEFEIPVDIEFDDEVYFEVKLSKNKIKDESDRIPARPGAQISNMQWSASEARRGETVTLSADVAGVLNDTEVTVTIYEYDRDSAHDRIVELPAVVNTERIEITWEYEYHEDQDETPTRDEIEEYGGEYNPPEYFFTIKVGEQEFGREQESGLLLFKDWIELRYLDAEGRPVANAEYVVTPADGEEREGTLDGEGFARVDDIPPGICRVRFIDPPPDDQES